MKQAYPITPQENRSEVQGNSVWRKALLEDNMYCSSGMCVVRWVGQNIDDSHGLMALDPVHPNITEVRIPQLLGIVKFNRTRCYTLRKIIMMDIPNLYLHDWPGFTVDHRGKFIK